MRAWLGDTSLDGFRGEHFGRAPLARPAAALAAIPLFGWDTLAKILALEPGPDALVVAKGQVIDVPLPRTLDALGALMGNAAGLVVRRAERCDAGLAALARAFAADLGGEAHVQLFVTPAGSHSFGWHYDVEHVFIAQTAGTKDYYFRANTVSPPFEAKPDFALVRGERSPLATARLLPGDWLYLPARWWHVAKCIEDSLSISVGVKLA